MKKVGALTPFLFALFLFITTTAFGQRRDIGRIDMDTRTKTRLHQNINATERVKTSGFIKRESARMNGAVQANEHANDRAKVRANENSVLAPATSGPFPYPQQKEKKERKEKKKH